MAEGAAHCYPYIKLLSATSKRKEGAVSRSREISHTVWHCQYQIVWGSKTHYRVLTIAIKKACYAKIHEICGHSSCEVVPTKCAAGACSSDRDNSSQVCDNHIDESVKKPELDAGFASFPASTKAEILWQ